MTEALRSFFSVEALDTRLAAPPRRPLATSPSKWHTLEYKLYGVVFAVCVPLMVRAAITALNEHNPNYPKYAHLLSPGWLFGRRVDNLDPQYRFFRDNLPMLAAMIVVHTACRRAVARVARCQRSTFDCVFGVAFLAAAHGVNCAKVALHLAVMYALGRVPSHRAALVLTWVYGILTLFVNDWAATRRTGLAALDGGWPGIIPRWDVFFNFTLLRMILYNLDYLERRWGAADREKAAGGAAAAAAAAGTVPPGLDDRARLTAPLPPADYCVRNYVAYTLYTPLFVAGPIVTFNDYLYQSNYHQCAAVQSARRTAVYFARLVFCILVMEFLLHYMYVVAVSKTQAWQGDTPFQVLMLGMFNLNIIWLKLLIPWRIFRFWALLDGIDPPENMLRCMDNNYSALAFWRAWHRLFNKWVTRYIYIPLGGGGKRRVLNLLCVFLFVAIWHDIELKLLVWGWLVVVFLLPEIAATFVCRRYHQRWWYTYLCGAGAVANIWMMMIANLFGFCLGREGTVTLLKEIFATVGGVEFFVLLLGALFCASQVMYEYREGEKRRGVFVRC